jgi:hypothetical protein
VANRTDYSGPNIYIGTRDSYTGLHADNNFAVLAVHHNLIGTNKVILFKAPCDIASAKSLYKEIIKTSDNCQVNPKDEIDIFDTLKFPIKVRVCLHVFVFL